MRSAFVSHSTSDDRYVAEMESFLRAAGFDDVFNDVSAIRPDEKFWPEIEKGIAKCEALVVVITFASSGSEWVKREVEYARDLSKKIIPVWIEDCPIPPIFAGRDVIDFRPGIRQERRFEISRIDKYAPAELIGREGETKLLNDAWEKVLSLAKGRPHILTFVALGGEGKTSLVAKWAAELAHQDWPGCDAAFAWSFYSKGTREQVAASSDLFLKEALTFFGDDADKEFAAGPAGAYEKGQRLARLVGQRRSLLVLDGLEPLQYAPASPTPGQLKDQGIAALLKGLAAASHGLCVVTTRYSLADLKAFWKATAPEVKLLRLSRDAGAHLLKALGVRGTAKEFKTLVEDVKGHALTLTLLGGFLKRAFHGDIRQRDRVKFEKADEKMEGGHAFRTMAAYEQWLLRDGGDEGRREVAVLRLMGLFDRPADAGCLAALLQAPAIEGLTEPLIGVVEEDWNSSLELLASAKLLTVSPETVSLLTAPFPFPTWLDAHPYLREYFGRSTGGGGASPAIKLAHGRLFEHLRLQTPPSDRPSLEQLQPMYQAVRHGCLAGLFQESLDVFHKQITRESTTYSITFLGAFSSDLSCLANFFQNGWTQVVPEFAESHFGLIGTVGYSLRGIGRLLEALPPSLESANRMAGVGDIGASVASKNLAELWMALGDLESATGAAETSVQRADDLAESQRGWPSQDLEVEMMCVINRTCLASILHARGERDSAIGLCINAEHRQRGVQPHFPILYSEQGFHCFQIIAQPIERLSWVMLMRNAYGIEFGDSQKREGLVSTINTAWPRIAQGLRWAQDNHFPLDLGLTYLANYQMATWVRRIFPDEAFYAPFAAEHLDQAMNWLRRAADAIHFVAGLIAGSVHHKSTGDADAASQYLDEAWDIAERGPMRLHQADIHLHRARLFFREAPYPWESPAADLAAAEKFINDCGYHRRDEELADAKAAILSN